MKAILHPEDGFKKAGELLVAWGKGHEMEITRSGTDVVWPGVFQGIQVIQGPLSGEVHLFMVVIELDESVDHTEIDKGLMVTARSRSGKGEGYFRISAVSDGKTKSGSPFEMLLRDVAADQKAGKVGPLQMDGPLINMMDPARNKERDERRRAGLSTEGV